MKKPKAVVKALKSHKHWENLMRKVRKSDNKKVAAYNMVIGAVLLAIFQFVYKLLGV